MTVTPALPLKDNPPAIACPPGSQSEFLFTFLPDPSLYVPPPALLGDADLWANDESEASRRSDSRRLRAAYVATLVRAGNRFEVARAMVRWAVGAGAIQLPAKLGRAS